MIKLGILDFDTSHVVEFTSRLNHKHSSKDQWVDGALVVIDCPGESKIMPERIEGYKKAMDKLGVKLVDKPEDMIGKVDGMLIESQEGGAHWGGPSHSWMPACRVTSTNRSRAVSPMPRRSWSWPRRK